MWSFFQRLFPFLFKDSPPQAKDKGLVIPPTDIVSDPEDTENSHKEEVRRLDVEGKILIRLERTHEGNDATLGELSVNGTPIAKTLEGPALGPPLAEQRAIPKGDYYLTLRKEGGLHTSYKFRFADFHKGMIQIKDVPNIEFVYLLIGNEASLSYGNVLLGRAYHEENLVQSEDAYKEVYNKILGLLMDGKEVVLRVE